MNDPRGSIWRKWDLHLHTPSSYDYKDKSVTDENIIEKLKENDIAVAAITDHHIMDISRITNLIRLGVSSGITILPGIEICTESRGSEPIHIIGIFPQNSGINYIWNEIESKTDLATQRQNSKADNQLYCNLINTTDLIHKLGGLVSIHAGSKTHTLEGITNSLPVKMAEKEDIAHSVDIYELGAETDQSGYVEKVFPTIGKYLPMILCSDNHKISEYTLKQNCWIKADPTFEGLKQIVYEPFERVKIQMLKPEEKNSYCVIDKIQINDPENFPNEIIFNQNMVSVIGSRSCGKSALLSLLGYSIDTELVKKRHDIIGLNDEYVQGYKWDNAPSTEVKWCDGIITKPNEENHKKIIYIPQNYLFTGFKEAGAISKLIKPVLFEKDDTQKEKLGHLENFMNKYEQDMNEGINLLFQVYEELTEINDEIGNLGDPKELKNALKELNGKEMALKTQSQVNDEEYKKFIQLSKKIDSTYISIKMIENDTSILENYLDDFSVNFRLLPKDLSDETLKIVSSLLEKEINKVENKIGEFIASYIEKQKSSRETLIEKVKKIKNENRELAERVRSNRELKELLKQKSIVNEKIESLIKLNKKESRKKKEIDTYLRLIKSILNEREMTIKKYVESVKCKVDSTLEIHCEIVRDNQRVTNEYFGIRLHQKASLKESKVYWKNNDGGEIFFDYSEYLNSPIPLMRAIINQIVEIFSNISEKEVIRKLCSRISRPEYVAVFEGDRVGGAKSSTMTPGKKALFALKMLIGEIEEDWPLLIDQPEDDLDSRSIYTVIVPFIKSKKKERQIILVTHDANMVVGADSEQVIVANRNGNDRPNSDRKTFNYTSGALENTKSKDENCNDTLQSQGVREHVCDILEGGEDAFDKRMKKYNISRQV